MWLADSGRNPASVVFTMNVDCMLRNPALAVFKSLLETCKFLFLLLFDCNGLSHCGYYPAFGCFYITRISYHLNSFSYFHIVWCSYLAESSFHCFLIVCVACNMRNTLLLLFLYYMLIALYWVLLLLSLNCVKLAHCKILFFRFYIAFGLRLGISILCSFCIVHGLHLVESSFGCFHIECCSHLVEF